MDILNKKRGIHLDSSFESGRRGSNPRPSAWKANALSTELLPQFLWAVMDSNHRRRSQLSYSQPHLATLVTAPIIFYCVAKVRLIL